MKHTSTTALIIGAGPTGLALGLELAAQQIPFRIVDRAKGRSDKSRALVVQARTLELLHRHGIARDLQKRGNRADGSTMVVAGRAVASFETEAVARLPNTAFPFQLLVSQEDTEYFLEESLGKARVAAAAEGNGKGARVGEVEWGVEARSIVQEGEGVTVVLGNGKEEEEEEEEETVRASFVIGCDGKNSTVRQAAGLTFEGSSYAQDFVLADAHVKWNDPSSRNHNRAYLCFGHGLLTVLPLKHDMVRVVAVRSSVTTKTGSKDRQELKLADFQRHFDAEMPRELGGTLHDATWLARFYLHHRGVNRYSNEGGRIFVAGDAAHVHSPVGGQGMNTGIQDAVNLGWKLGAVARGERPLSFLASYHAERYPVGQKLLETTDRAFTWMSWMNPVFLWVRNLLLPWVLPRVFADVERVRANFWEMSEFGISYRDAAGGVVGTAAEGLGKGLKIHGGDRVLDGRIRGCDDDGEEGEGEKYLLELLDARTHHLLLFSGGVVDDSEAASEGDLHRAETKFAENSRIAAKVHAIFAEKPNGQTGYVDVDGVLHREFGFSKPAYILVRPDGYAAHVGPLSALDDLIRWFNGPTA